SPGALPSLPGRQIAKKKDRRSMAEISVLRPQGRLDNVTGVALDSQISKLIGDGANRLLLNMAEISYVSSAGLRVVLSAAKRMRSVGGQFWLCSLNEHTKEIFEVTGFSRFLNISDSQEDAMNRLQG